MMHQTLINTASSTDGIPVKRRKQARGNNHWNDITLIAHVHILYFIQLINDDYISVVKRHHSISNTNHLNEIK